MYTMLVIIVTGFLVIMAGCKKKDPEPQPASKHTLMTMNFTDNFINPKLGAIVFASDSLGQIISDTLIKGNMKLKLMLRTGAKIPGRFTLTIVTWEPSMHNFEVKLQSYLQVATTEWTLKGFRPDTLGHVTINLSGIPNSSLVMYSNSGYSNLTTINSNVRNLSYLDPDVLLVKTENYNQKYLWVDDIKPGNLYNLDFSNAEMPVLDTILIAGQYYEARIWGFRESDQNQQFPIMTNYSLGNIPVENKIVVAAFPQYFNEYTTELKLVENWSSATSYTTRTHGPIPKEFKKCYAGLQSFADKSHGTVELVTTGTYTTGIVNWQFYGHNNQIFTWDLAGNDTTKHFQLPDISPMLKQTFPTLSLDSLYFHHLQLDNYPDITGYENLLTKLFNPAEPAAVSSLNVSTLTFGQGK